jgi:hypothetical protein
LIHQFVMAGLKREARLRAYVPAIHVFCAVRKKDVDARDKPGHDVAGFHFARSGPTRAAMRVLKELPDRSVL